MAKIVITALIQNGPDDDNPKQMTKEQARVLQSIINNIFTDTNNDIFDQIQDITLDNGFMVDTLRIQIFG